MADGDSVQVQAGHQVLVPRVVISETDPGAIGAANWWVRLDAQFLVSPSLWVRNLTDDGWVDFANSSLGLGLAGYVTDLPIGSIHVDDDGWPMMLVYDADGNLRADLILSNTNGQVAASSYAADSAPTGTLELNSTGAQIRGGAEKSAIMASDGGLHDLTLLSDGSLTLDSVPIGTQAAAVADLALTVSDPPTQVEVQAIADGFDALLAALRASGELAT